MIKDKPWKKPTTPHYFWCMFTREKAEFDRCHQPALKQQSAEALFNGQGQLFKCDDVWLKTKAASLSRWIRCLGAATLRHILCFIHSLKRLLAQSSSKKKILYATFRCVPFYIVSSEPEALGLTDLRGSQKKNKSGHVDIGWPSLSPSWFSLPDLIAMEMQMLVNFKLCWIASCNKRHGLRYSQTEHSLLGFPAVLLPAVCFWVNISWDSLTWLMVLTAKQPGCVQGDRNSYTE